MFRLVALVGLAAIPLQGQSAAPLPSFDHVPGVRVQNIPLDVALHGPDGMAVDAAGRLVIANWGGGQGRRLLRVDPGSGRGEVLSDSLHAPDGVLVLPNGDLVVSNFGDGTVVRLSTSGHLTTIAQGLGRPSGLALLPDGTVLVADFGDWNGTAVRRILPGGTVDTLVAGLAAPIGLAVAPDGRVFTSSFGSGLVHVVTPDGGRRVHATIPNAPPAMLQYLALDAAGTLYLPSYGHNRIYRIDAAGRVTILAGSGRKGARDGDGADAEFDGPNSVALSADGRTLWVTEYNANRLRRIDLPPA